MTTVDLLRQSFGDWRAVHSLQWDGQTLRGRGAAGLTRRDLLQLAACLGRGEPVGWITHDTAYMVPDWCPVPRSEPPPSAPSPPAFRQMTDAETLGLQGDFTAEVVRRRQRELSQALAAAADRLIATLDPARDERWNPDLDAVFA